MDVILNFSRGIYYSCVYGLSWWQKEIYSYY